MDEVILLRRSFRKDASEFTFGRRYDRVDHIVRSSDDRVDGSVGGHSGVDIDQGHMLMLSNRIGNRIDRL